MKVLSYPHSSLNEEQKSLLSDIKVTMHVVSPVRNDGRILREATALTAKGVAVAVVDVESRDTCPDKEVIQGLRVQHVMMSREFAETRFTKGATIRTLYIFLRSILCLLAMPTDIYHAHDTIALPATVVAAMIRRKPLIFDAHELPLAELRVRHPWLRTLIGRLFIFAIRRCAAVITVSAPIAEVIHRQYKARRVTLVRNTPIYQEAQQNERIRQYLDLGPDVRIALYQGNIQEDRRLDTLVRAVTFLDRDIVLVLMGKNMRRTVVELQALAYNEGVSGRVKFLPPVPYEELLEWTASADVGLIIYSPDHSLNVRFCLPNKLFEYMMAGLPVLATQLDAVAEILHNYNIGQTIASTEPEAVAAGIKAMVEDRDKQTRMRQNALRAASQEFNWGREQQHLLDIYCEVVHSYTRSRESGVM